MASMGPCALSTMPDAAPLGRDPCWTGSWWQEVLGGRSWENDNSHGASQVLGEGVPTFPIRASSQKHFTLKQRKPKFWGPLLAVSGATECSRWERKHSHISTSGRWRTQMNRTESPRLQAWVVISFHSQEAVTLVPHVLFFPMLFKLQPTQNLDLPLSLTDGTQSGRGLLQRDSQHSTSCLTATKPPGRWPELHLYLSAMNSKDPESKGLTRLSGASRGWRRRGRPTP